jgi:uncharacterized membrane protein
MKTEIFTVLAIVGALYSLYLFYLEHFVGVCFTGYCSEYPALLGFFWFVSAPLTLKFDKINKLWRISGVLGISCLVFIELYHRTVCPFCSLAHILGLILIVISSI